MKQHERHIESCPRCKAPVQLLWRTRTGDYEFFVGCTACGAQTGAHMTGREAWREWDALCKGTEHGASRR